MTVGTLRPTFVLGLLSAIAFGVLLAILPPLYETLDDAAQELRTRRDQWHLLASQVAHKAELEAKLRTASAGFDDQALLYHGASLTEVQAQLQSMVRGQVQASGARLKSIEIRANSVAGGRTRLRLILAASGENNAIVALIDALEKVHPRLDVASLHIRADGPPTGTAQPLALDVELDGYTDAS